MKHKTVMLRLSSYLAFTFLSFLDYHICTNVLHAAQIFAVDTPAF